MDIYPIQDYVMENGAHFSKGQPTNSAYAQPDISGWVGLNRVEFLTYVPISAYSKCFMHLCIFNCIW
jgi:hypothetical protein